MSTIHDPKLNPAARKAAWLEGVSRRLPVGTLVTGPEWAAVEHEDDTGFSGFGTVLGYDLGVDWQEPFVLVRGAGGDVEYVYDDCLTVGGAK